MGWSIYYPIQMWKLVNNQSKYTNNWSINMKKKEKTPYKKFMNLNDVWVENTANRKYQ